MAQRARAIEFEDESPGSSMLGRFLLWAGLAAIALGSAALAAQTQTGAERLAGIIGHGKGASRSAAPAASVAIRPSDAELESRRLAEAVRLLAADRDRLLARLDALERSLDVTGAFPRENAAPPPSSSPLTPSLPPNWSLVPSNIPPAAGVPPASVPPANVPAATPSADTGVSASASHQAARATGGLAASEQAAESVATKTEFAVDIGGEQTFEGLRALWASLKGSHGALFEGLRPVAAVREGAKPGALELRLVVGPLNNAGAAARLCATLAATGLACQPTVFDGQRFALR